MTTKSALARQTALRDIATLTAALRGLHFDIRAQAYDWQSRKRDWEEVHSELVALASHKTLPLTQRTPLDLQKKLRDALADRGLQALLRSDAKRPKKEKGLRELIDFVLDPAAAETKRHLRKELASRRIWARMLDWTDTGGPLGKCPRPFRAEEFAAANREARKRLRVFHRAIFPNRPTPPKAAKEIELWHKERLGDEFRIISDVVLSRFLVRGLEDTCESVVVAAMEPRFRECSDRNWLSKSAVLQWNRRVRPEYRKLASAYTAGSGAPETCEERARRRHSKVDPLMKAAHIRSLRDLARRAGVNLDKNTPRDYLNGKTAHLRNDARDLMAVALNTDSANLPD